MILRRAAANAVARRFLLRPAELAAPHTPRFGQEWPLNLVTSTGQGEFMNTCFSACEVSVAYGSCGSLVSVNQSGRCALLGSPTLRSTPSGSGGGGAGQASGSALVCLTMM